MMYSLLDEMIVDSEKEERKKSYLKIRFESRQNFLLSMKYERLQCHPSLVFGKPELVYWF